MKEANTELERLKKQNFQLREEIESKKGRIVFLIVLLVISIGLSYFLYIDDSKYHEGYNTGYEKGEIDGYNEGYLEGWNDCDAESYEDYSSGKVYITDTGGRYHRLDCHYLQGSCNPIPLAKAVSLGYTPCSYCW